jgi:REP element-mobilizing transposase RayT
MWTRAYFVSTAGNIASSTIQKYIKIPGKNSTNHPWDISIIISDDR